MLTRPNFAQRLQSSSSDYKRRKSVFVYRRLFGWITIVFSSYPGSVCCTYTLFDVLQKVNAETRPPARSEADTALRFKEREQELLSQLDEHAQASRAMQSKVRTNIWFGMEGDDRFGPKRSSMCCLWGVRGNTDSLATLASLSRCALN